ncbi:unnamed protein product [Adineta steineri]|uniref:Phosphodiesterase n=1 Tax=Adineta steineri TaxID=433720 RepID=A0A814LYE5_9BILA|nr:unnamed protein product [Adineta steineri]CAF1071972.1 unnamed protein product [Adineta steineri]CAF1435159.1 unnamed protein product [Adineta steineri]CAF1625769.1 unnamed protein product [Adineta steineri]
MNKSNHFDLSSTSNIKPENSSMTTVNILGRLRIATEQVRKVQSNLVKDGSSDQVETLDKVGKELDGILYNLVEILSDDTRQSEINVTSNDGQISKWLEQTFSSKQQRSSTAAQRFDSIRAIIQASSFVNALQRQMRQNAKERVSAILDLPVDIHKLNSWSFNMMEYDEPLNFSILLIFDAHDIITRFHIDIETLKNFNRALTDGYQKFRTPYHNDFHGADVLQTTHCLLIKSNLMSVFTQLEIAALLFAAAIHDYEHPGLNNGYLVKTKNDLALTYNDFSVLENHHASSVFKLLRDKRYNIWSHMNTNEFRSFRSLVISLVLATDMANHASLIERLSTYFFFKETNSTATSADSKTLLQTLLHAADISNAAKPWDIYIHSAEKVIEEFFIQGDLEKLNYQDDKPTFDRESTDIVQLQIGFITHIVHPTFDVLLKVVQIDSLENVKKDTSATANLTNPIIPWQNDLQLNLETWKQISKHADMEQMILSRKPFKLNFDYLQEYVEKAKTFLKKRSQHDLLLNRPPSS